MQQKSERLRARDFQIGDKVRVEWYTNTGNETLLAQDYDMKPGKSIPRFLIATIISKQYAPDGSTLYTVHYGGHTRQESQKKIETWPDNNIKYHPLSWW